MSSAVGALVAQPDTPSPTAHAQVDQFSAFGQTIVQRLRSMSEEESLSAMAEISAMFFSM